jgi:hypothetical protein
MLRAYNLSRVEIKLGLALSSYLRVLYSCNLSSKRLDYLVGKGNCLEN